MASYAEQYDTVLRAIKTNLSGIIPANGYNRTVVLVHERDDVIRPEDETGDIIKVTDETEEIRLLTAGEAESTFRYLVEGWIVDEDPNTLRNGLRDFVADFLGRHFADVYLAAADLANGGAGSRLVKMHRPLRVTRRYRNPEAYFKAELSAVFCWTTGTI